MRVKPNEQNLKRVRNGDTVCIIGGGPGGSSCAIALMREARKLGRDIQVVVLEQKKFEEERQFNQCIGVLSPPLETILSERLGLKLPPDLILKEITGYRLHSNRFSLDLDGEDHEKTYAVQRSKFDAFMLEEARKAGARIVNCRVLGVEIFEDEVLIYTDGENYTASVVVGAFGMDDGTCRMFEEGTPYREPDFLNTVITRIYPGQKFLREMGPVIQAFLLGVDGLEFGAVTPKQDHISINVAGRRASSEVMLKFLQTGAVQNFLPPHKRREKPLHYFKGKFPISPAKHLYGDRYVTVGDAAGLIRPFKGKGINSACLTGAYAADCIVNAGVSKAAFARYYMRDCDVFLQDIPYGKVLRLMVNLSRDFGFMDHLLKIAEHDPVFMRCLFNCVSAHKTYKEIFWETASFSLALDILRGIVNRFLFRKL